MKFGVPWSVKGIRPEARETAREAARRSGMSLGDWLNSVILQQAAEDGLRAPDDDEDDDGAYAHELTGVHQRLDDLTRRIEHFARTGPAAYAPKRKRDENSQIADLIGRLDRRLDQFAQTQQHAVVHMPPHMAPAYAPMPPQMAAPSMVPPMAPYQSAPVAPPAMPPVPPALDRAIAEISARQRALNNNPAPAAVRPQARAPKPAPVEPAPAFVPAFAPAPAQAPMFAPMPTQDLSGLEDQLRRITDQIETLRRPGVEEAINALRGELADIGRALNDAMPRRAIDAIEKQIQGLTQRIAEGRQAGVDAGALGGVENGLAEVRDALRGLTPAENLVGFNDAVHALAHKIDLIVAQKDPATLQQLERAITTLRDMAGHVASNEAVSGLAAQVRILDEKVEHLALRGDAGDALNNLEHRIGALADALAERAQSGNSVPPRLEALVMSLSDKIEQIQQSRGDNLAVGHLEDRIVSLVERLDASDSRLSHLEAIERGLGDLLIHIEDLRTSRQAEPMRPDNSAGVDALKHDLVRTQNALEAVNGTLGHVVDRLVMIEKDIRGEGRKRAAPAPALETEPLELTQPIGKIAVRAVSTAADAPPRMPLAAPLQMPPTAPAPAPAAAFAPPPSPPSPPAPKRMPPAGHRPIDPDLPPDLPLEPGSGPPRLRANPGARIAASEAALGNARPAAETGGKSSFIAAARRAAQAAVQEANTRVPRVETNEPYDGESSSLRTKMIKRVKSLFVAASVVGIVVGGVQIVGHVLHRGGSEMRTAKTEKTSSIKSAGKAKTSPALATEMPEPANLPVTASSDAPPSGNIMSSALPPLSMSQPLQSMPSLLNPPALNPSAQNDVTGSISKSARKNAAAHQATTLAVANGDRLPGGIGGARLRNAAVAGDPAAEYEIAVRFAEGRGVPSNLEEAARWYERSAAQGLAPAQFRYASLLEKGNGVKKDLNQARRLYLAAAAKGNAKAMHNLAVLYAEGVDGKPDYATAAQWFRKAALHGVGDSQYNLGVLTARGLGTEKNLAESYKWFALAAVQGDKECAKKRDEVGALLDAQALASMQKAVKTFVAEPQPHEATAVPAPAGGWDDADATPAVRSKARPAGPLSLGAFKVGNR
jgi:localization factor PodJL